MNKETPTALSVSQLNQRAKQTLEREVGEVWVEGEHLLKITATRTLTIAISAKTYFLFPYCSCKGGTNENTSGQFVNISRKGLEYRPPAQVFLGDYSGALAIADASRIG